MIWKLFLLCMQVVNSVVMNHVTIGDGCSIQGSVICSNVQLQERVVLKDCQVLFLPLCLSLSVSPCVCLNLLGVCVW